MKSINFQILNKSYLTTSFINKIIIWIFSIYYSLISDHYSSKNYFKPPNPIDTFKIYLPNQEPSQKNGNHLRSHHHKNNILLWELRKPYNFPWIEIPCHFATQKEEPNKNISLSLFLSLPNLTNPITIMIFK